jgi:putative addiction module component (TIGR02574 family)
MHLDEIKKMPQTKQIQLVQDIWDSLIKDNIELTVEMKVELESRLAYHKAGKAKYYSLEESRKRNDAFRNGWKE